MRICAGIGRFVPFLFALALDTKRAMRLLRGRYEAVASECCPGAAVSPAATVTPAEQALQAQVDSRLTEALNAFANRHFGGDDPENPMLSARAQWRAEVDRCPDPACRQAALRSQLQRLNFGLGHSRERIPGIPWSSSLYRIADEDVSGYVSLLPLGGPRIVVSVSTSAREDARWICTVAAFGELGSDGIARMKVIGEEGEFLIRTRGADRILLEPAHPDDDPLAVCRVGPIFGDYRAASRDD